jgi:hypothetical protein
VKAGGSLPRGRRLRHEVPNVPTADALSTVEREAQSVLRALVEQVGGRFGSKRPVPVEKVDVLTTLFDEWAERYGTSFDKGIHFSGRPGLWQALDALYPLEDPNRWDTLREAIIAALEEKNWRRVSPPRGSAFDILE